MKKNYKAIIIITWSNIFAWLLSIFLLCGCLFFVGVLVGRDLVPIEFDIKKIADLPQSYFKELGDKKPGLDASQIKPIDVFNELKDPPPKMIPEETIGSSGNVLSQSESIKTESAPMNAPQPPDDSNQTLTPSETPSQESEVSVTSEPEEDLEKTDSEMAGEKTGTPENIQPVSVKYVIQVASLNSLETANSIKNKLLEKGYPAFCVDTDIKGKVWHRVRIGPYDDQTLAKNDYSRLKESGIDALLFSVENQTSF